MATDDPIGSPICEDDINPEMLPRMMFAQGEESIGVRVLTYQSSRAMRRILATLYNEEITRIEKSPFGKILEIAEKPFFSGIFARYIMSRQLKVMKKLEAWFRFAGRPIQFSLREFAIVTGLNCGYFPPKSKLKRKVTITEKPYWSELFGKVDVVTVSTVSTVIKMLKKKTVADNDIQIKYGKGKPEAGLRGIISCVLNRKFESHVSTKDYINLKFRENSKMHTALGNMK